MLGIDTRSVLRELHIDYYQRVRQVVARATGADHVVVMNAQLFTLDEGAMRDALPDELTTGSGRCPRSERRRPAPANRRRLLVGRAPTGPPACPGEDVRRRAVRPCGRTRCVPHEGIAMKYFRTLTTGLILVAASSTLAGCLVSAPPPPPVRPVAYGSYGYEQKPVYHDGYVVQFDTAGYPYIYVGRAPRYVPHNHPRYPDYMRRSPGYARRY